MPRITVHENGKLNGPEKGLAVSDLIGCSRKFRAVLEDVRTASATDCPVLIRGEEGTGKELIARAIHNASSRKPHRFLAVNCAAISAALLESGLFGHDERDLTVAVSQSSGSFHAAEAGTLFLDDVEELPLELQSKLLRALREQQILGSRQKSRVDVRIVAATNQDLEAMVNQRSFLADLYNRLKVLLITLPPLREREGDIPLLVTHFVRTFAERHSRSIEHVPAPVITALTRHQWHGNIGELQKFVERSVILTTGSELQAPVEELMKEKIVDHGVRTLANAGDLSALSTRPLLPDTLAP
jgi:formate hydrogenlyase transcriptional activator